MNDESAFPMLERNWKESTETYRYELKGGLTKREYAAIHIAAGLVARREQDDQEVADEAVDKADALLKRLSAV